MPSAASRSIDALACSDVNAMCPLPWRWVPGRYRRHRPVAVPSGTSGVDAGDLDAVLPPPSGLVEGLVGPVEHLAARHAVSRVAGDTGPYDRARRHRLHRVAEALRHEQRAHVVGVVEEHGETAVVEPEGAVGLSD